MKRVMVVIGTRPDAIKMCPLIKELEKSSCLEVKVCSAGQHREQLAQALEVFSVIPDIELGIMEERQELWDLTSRALILLREAFERERPDLVLVHGDTTTAFCAALAAYYMRIRVGHVEAGLRTGDLFAPFPEEYNRRCVDMISALHFAPTRDAVDNLLREGIPAEGIYVTGNTVADALNLTLDEDFEHPLLDWASGSRLILVTAHRRESLGDRMEGMFRAIRRLLEDTPGVKAVFPVHLNPAVRRIAGKVLKGCSAMKLTEPLRVDEFHNIMKHSSLVLTDSGGIQEEGCCMGVPVAVLRDKTERQEGVRAGGLYLAGTGEDDIYEACRTLLEDDEILERMRHAENPYGDGCASMNIRRIVEEDILDRH